MEALNRREDYRVEVPAASVREIALWFTPERELKRLAACDLGRPHLTLSRLGPGRMTLTDLSIRGFGLLLALPEEAVQKLLGAKACMTYVQLWDQSAEDPHGVLSVFTYNLLARVAPKDGNLFLGVRFKRFAVASRLDKSLDFLDAGVCGVTALTHWCDNVARGAKAGPGRRGGGLDLDNLLTEIEAELAHPADLGEENP